MSGVHGPLTRSVFDVGRGMGALAIASVVAQHAARMPAARRLQTPSRVSRQAIGDESVDDRAWPPMTARIQFLEKRVAEHPTDPTLPTRLASALLDRAKLTHDFTLYPRARRPAERR